MALALYRRYRPDTFDGVIGQDQVVVPLSRALDQGKLTHAYLFSGPRGCGKTSSARILARCINCVKGPTSHPCGVCESCRDLSVNGPGSIDVVEIDAASHNGVDDARELRERAGFAPARDRYKIFILDEAHMVSKNGFNALLKIVEEPPEHVMFIFATTEPEKVIPTIRSRTHHYPFRLVPSEIMGPYLEQICQKEGISADAGVLKLAMRAGGGSVRDTLSVLDQLMVGAVDGTITYASASALLGFTPDELISSALDAVIDKDGAGLYAIIEKVVVGGFEPKRFVEDLLARLRDLIVLTLAGSRATQALSDEAEAENTDDLQRQASAFGLATLTRLADQVNTTLASMAGTTSPRLRLELMAAQLLTIVEPPQPQHAVAAVQSQQTQSSALAPSVTGYNPPPIATQASRRPAAPAQQRVQAESQAPAQQKPVQPQLQTSAPVQPQAQAHQPTPDIELWREVLKGMPADLSKYVVKEKVPVVEFTTNAIGGKHLTFTFNTPLSQHAFALAVTNKNLGVPGLVQLEVRKVFGATASIAPNTVAANGEPVQMVSKMTDQQKQDIKREIAMSAVKEAMSASTAQERRETNDSGQQEPASADTDDHHRQSSQDSDDPWAAEEPARPEQAPAEPVPDAPEPTQELAPQPDDDDDPWANPEPPQSSVPTQSTSAGTQSEAPQQRPSPRSEAGTHTVSNRLESQGQPQPSTPTVAPEDDTYSMDDENIDSTQLVDEETLKKMFDVRDVRQISRSNGDN